MSERELELFRSHTAAQDKYVYFLLAAAGAAITFAVQRTADSQLHTTQIPLGLAVLCWSISFYAGCKNRQSTLVGILANTVKVTAEDARVGQAAANTQTAAGSTANRWFNRQFRYLVLGAICFLTWHITGMWLRTPH